LLNSRGDDVANRFPFAPAIGALTVLVAALASLVAMAGMLPQLVSRPLVAEVRLEPMLLPGGVALDPVEISNFIEERLTENAERDVAIRMGLGPEQSERLMTIVIPRLVNSAVISRMIDRIPPLKAVVSLHTLRTTARIVVRNRSDAPLTDVAMALPGIVLAERADGQPMEVVARGGITAMRLGTLEPGEARIVTSWLDVPLAAAERFSAEMALGASGGQAGELMVYAGEGWVGEDLNAFPWARWLVGGLLAAVAFASAVMLAALVWGSRRRRASEVRPA
jgi:hypothetical protein